MGEVAYLCHPIDVHLATRTLQGVQYMLYNIFENLLNYVILKFNLKRFSCMLFQCQILLKLCRK